MIGGMPRPRPPYLQRHVTQHRKVVWYVRVGRGSRVRIRARFGTAEFDTEYQAAISGASRPKKGVPVVGTLGWLVGRYREVGAWTNLSPATRKQRENIFAHVLDAAADKKYAHITKATIVAGCERRSKTPAQARHFLGTMRGLFQWALKADLIKTDPTNGVERPRPKKGGGFIAWTEDDVSAYEQMWRLEHASAFGSTYCSTLVCAAATL